MARETNCNHFPLDILHGIHHEDDTLCWQHVWQHLRYSPSLQELLKWLPPADMKSCRERVVAGLKALCSKKGAPKNANDAFWMMCLAAAWVCLGFIPVLRSLTQYNCKSRMFAMLRNHILYVGPKFGALYGSERVWCGKPGGCASNFHPGMLTSKA